MAPLAAIYTEPAGWPWIFMINIPIGLAALVAAPAAGPRVGFAVSAALAVLGIVCALVMFAARCPDRAACPAPRHGHEGAPQR